MPSSPYINTANVKYKFRFKPADGFTTAASIKVTFPDQVAIGNRVGQAIGNGMIVTVTSNKYAVITGIAAYNPSTSGYIEFTLD